MNTKRERARLYGALALTVLSVMLLCALAAGYQPLGYNPYHSYSLQAQAWLDGRLDLGQNYPWLEIAMYQGKYYISFPPFPSFVMLPFVAVFGVGTPDRLISLGIGVVAAVYAFKLAYLYLKDEKKAFFMSLFLCISGNYLMIATASGVWFIAQSMGFALTLMAVYYGSTDRAGHSFAALLALCCAMGCRPFQAVYIPLVIYLIYRKLAKGESLGWVPLIRQLMVYAIPAIVLGCVYMLLNILRFGNPLEFGHTYLPEFLDAEKGQFSLAYVSQNLGSLLRLPWFSEEDALTFPRFNGMNIFMVFPILVSYAVYWIGDWFDLGGAEIGSDNSRGILYFGLPVLLLLHIFMLCMHRTMGGFHYGHRYIADAMPCVFLGLLLLVRDRGRHGGFIWNVPAAVFGLALNVYLTVLFLRDYA